MSITEKAASNADPDFMNPYTLQLGKIAPLFPKHYLDAFQRSFRIGDIFTFFAAS
jgi:hypothetical protein